MPGLVKIGRTTNTPDTRASELYTTGVPCRFQIEQFWRVPEQRLDTIEKELHRVLDPYRFNSKREFFEIDPSEAVDFIDKHIGTCEGGTFAGTADRLCFGAAMVCIFTLMLFFILSQ